MKILRPFQSLYERHMNENRIAEIAAQQATIDYNIMMGILEDPSEDEESEREGNE